jgi:hypothetical protein
MYEKKEKILISSSEISPEELVPDLLNKLHDELNNYVKRSDKPGSNNINDEDEDNNETFDFTSEEKVISFGIKDFTEKYRSKISDLFYFLIKTIHECPKCQTITGYSSDIYTICKLNPDDASIDFEKADLNIFDLLKHYQAKRLKKDLYEDCPKCGNIIEEVNLTNIFYTSPPNLILSISYKEKDIFNLNIDESINIKDFVERTDVSKVNYRLVGAIFIENIGNENKYISITRNIQLNDDSWLYFNGNSFKKSSFNELSNHKNLRMLFYSTE